MSKRANSFFIALIPEIQDPSRVTDFRTISLINSTSKLLLKVLANILKEELAGLISEQQFAFIKERNIS